MLAVSHGENYDLKREILIRDAERIAGVYIFGTRRRRLASAAAIP
jgi:hypothetical protein